tara:strand:+ start:319 stop:870 length:552 start_codon:yes stop_codon:yes gene_type:complete
LNYIFNKIRKELHCKRFSYNTESYPFKENLEELFGCDCSKLHNYLGSFEKFQRNNDQNTLVHKVFYSNFKEKIFPIYYNFQKNFIAQIIKEPYYFQVIPTFRIGLPGNKFVGEYHKDSFYNHKAYEVNFNLGISGFYGNASLKTKLHPQEMNLLIWNALMEKFFLSTILIVCMVVKLMIQILR